MRRSLILFLLLVGANGLAQVDQDLQAAVTAGNQAWINGMRSGDAALAASAFATDAVNCSADAQCVTGIAAITSQMRSRLASYGRAQTATVTPASIVRDRDLAYEWGSSELFFGGGQIIRGRYVTVWQRQPGGGWKIVRNMSLPMAREGREGRQGRDSGGPPRREESFTVRCESGDMGRHSCAVPYQVNRVEMLRQVSGSPCVKNSTWGSTSNSIWVDRGCRAEFTVYAYVTDAAPAPTAEPPVTEYNDSRSTQTLRCESTDMNYRLCPAGGPVRSARLVRQLSGSGCTESQTWGWKADGVWVDKGCRAEFEVTVR